MKAIIAIALVSILVFGLSACTNLAKHTDSIQNGDGSSSEIVTIIRDSLKNDPVFQWANHRADSVLFQDALVIPPEVEYTDTTSEIEVHIRAFQNKFHSLLLPDTWVLGYVLKGTKVPQLPGPTIEVTNGTKVKIKWVNELKETMQECKKYNFPAQGLKYYPMLYDTRRLDDSIPANRGAAIPMITQALYPETIDPARMKSHSDHGFNMFHSTYYSTTVHLHGANLSWHSDGYTANSTVDSAGVTPNQTSYGLFGPYERNKQFVRFTYPNTFPEANYDTQDTTLGRHGAILWYHDHSIMRTTANVYMGLTGAYIIEGVDEHTSLFNNLQKPYKKGLSRATSKPDIKEIQDIPLLLSDKMFTKSGRLYYESKYDSADGGSRQPEFYGNTITVNGRAWPYHKVKRQLYRFRIINTSSSRFYRLALARWKNGEVDTTAIDERTMVQIGTEGGLMADSIQPRVTVDDPLMLAPGERADVLINFSQFSASAAESLVLLNLATSEPYQEKDSNNVHADTLKAAHRSYENFVMQFRIEPYRSRDGQFSGIRNDTLMKRLKAWSADPAYKKMLSKLAIFDEKMQQVNFRRFRLNRSRRSGPVIPGSQEQQRQNFLPMEVASRIPFANQKYTLYDLTLTEAASFDELSYAVKAQYEKIDSVMPGYIKDLSFPMAFLNGSEWDMEANTPAYKTGPLAIKKVGNQTTEVWKVANTTCDTHPIHIHLNRFRILGRTNLAGEGFHPIEGRERGWKDVVRVKPDSITYLLVTYALSTDEDTTESAQFVYHCHILEHEDVSMMRRLLVQTKTAAAHNPQQQAVIKPAFDRFNIPTCYGAVGLASTPVRLPTRKPLRYASFR
jgi:FtsP/CotA-like multicopper oxidase with cupredoxin domain